MCTISWFYDRQDYHVFFNRDEQKTRARAFPPQLFESSLPSLMPIDPEGNGSWLSSNAAGLTLALLNFYQGRLPKGPLRSRGQIVKRLSACQNAGEVLTALNKFSLPKYAPFSLLVFTQNAVKSPVEVPMFRWTGRELLNIQQTSPLISSALFYQDVRASRVAVFEKTLLETDKHDVALFYRLHRDHSPHGPSASSICMHREDAQTVSFSHVHVGCDRTEFHYWDGAPCTVANPQTFALSRL